MRSEEEVVRAMDAYGDTVRRLCLVRLKRREDTEDIFQTVFLKYLQQDRPFESPEHEKAWFIRVTLNACRDLLRFWARRPTVPLEALAAQAAPEPEDRTVLEAVLSLPQKYRDAVYLHYYEGYSAPEIGDLLGKNPNTVYTLLTRARALLREKLGGEADG
nr:sigma-70 family RNA polymerase sigma factor [Intestinimonas timonensis]